MIKLTARRILFAPIFCMIYSCFIPPGQVTPCHYTDVERQKKVVIEYRTLLEERSNPDKLLAALTFRIKKGALNEQPPFIRTKPWIT